MNRFCTFLVVVSLLSTAKSYSQSDAVGSWGIATFVVPSSAGHRWGGYAELQVRTDETFYRKFFYDEAKAGVSYALDNNYVALIGAGRYSTFDYRDPGRGVLTGENRVWEQLTFSQFLKRIKFEHRYRAEQRWVNGVFRNRFRYRLNPVVPINHTKMQANTLFLSVFDEIFLNNRAPHFERNRVAVTAGYQFSKTLSVQAGWINQYNYNLSSTNDKDNMIVNMIYTLDRKKSSSELLPTTKD